jgi:hypothetical protein
MHSTIIAGSKNISAFMGLSWPKIRELHRKEGLPLAKAGRKWLADRDMLSRWLQRQCEADRPEEDTQEVA